MDLVAAGRGIGGRVLDVFGKEKIDRIKSAKELKTWPSKVFKEKYGFAYCFYLMSVFVDFSTTKITFRQFLIATIIAYPDELAMTPFLEYCFGDVACTRVSCPTFVPPCYSFLTLFAVFGGRQNF